MRFSTLLLSVVTLGTTTLAFATATPASAQKYYGHKHYAHSHYAHSRYRHYAHYDEGRQIVVHPQETVLIPSPGYTWGPVAAVGTLVGGTGQAVEGVFTGAGAVVGSFLGGVFGGAGGALRLPAELCLWRSFRRAVQCGRGSGRSAVPGGGRRFRSAAGQPRRLLSHSGSTSSDHGVERNTRSHCGAGEALRSGRRARPRSHQSTALDAR